MMTTGADHDHLLSLGAQLVSAKQFEPARAQYQRGLARYPESPALWSNLGVLHSCLDDHGEAERCFRQALALDPDYSKARFNLSQVLLRQGRFAEGWPALEARPWNQLLLARIPAPRWQGQSLAGKSLLLGVEGGHGDMLQYCRYAALLKQQGVARLGLVCQPALKRLLATLPGVDVLVAVGETVPGPDWDFWSLPLSLPFQCGTRLATIPAAIPYLRARPQEVRTWNARLTGQGLRVGLAWKGNPQFENDGERSLADLHSLAPLARSGLRFVSLQTGPGPEQAAAPPPGLDLLDASPWLHDFADTAALVTNLDLVISVDTAVAHLAGALGKPCWLLLPHHQTDCRWLLDRKDSPWYPKHRLFRQGAGQGWAPVIAAVAAALRAFSPG